MSFRYMRLALALAILACLVSSMGCRQDQKGQSSEASASQEAAPSSSSDSEGEEEPTVRELNGDTKECEVYSYKSAGNYTLDVDFEGDQARINFPSGGYKYVDIDDPDSTEFSSISATDHDGESWEITVSDPPKSEDSDGKDEGES